MARLHFPIDQWNNNESYIMFEIHEPVSNLLNADQDADRFGSLRHTVFLHAPNQVQEGNSHRYQVVNGRIIAAAANLGSEGLLAGVADVFGGFQTILENTLPSVVQNASGIATQQVQNPQEEQMYQAPNFRTHNFNYEMTATSEAEASRLQEIISILRAASYPRAVEASGGRLSTRFKVPDQFRITHLKKQNNEVKSMGRPAKCVLTSMNVNYTGAGIPVSYDSGNPAFVNLDLTFTETNLLRRTHDALN